jgi:hypothetical protein
MMIRINSVWYRSYLFTGLVCFLLIVLGCLSSTTRTVSAAQNKNTLTIYVNKNMRDGGIIGHVFIGISNGKREFFYGWYSDAYGIEKPLALIGQKGGHLRDDSQTDWDVRKAYIISEEGYKRAMEAVREWNQEHKPWSPTHHCGNFAAKVAGAAGIVLSDVPKPLVGDRTFKYRPENMGEHLIKTGGELNATGATPKRSPHPILFNTDGNPAAIEVPPVSQPQQSEQSPNITTGTSYTPPGLFKDAPAHPEIVSPPTLQEALMIAQQKLDEMRARARNADQEATEAETQLKREKDEGETEGISRRFVNGRGSRQRVKVRIPEGWVPCQCPASHPGAGIVDENGTQWHTSLLHCP